MKAFDNFEFAFDYVREDGCPNVVVVVADGKITKGKAYPSGVFRPIEIMSLKKHQFVIVHTTGLYGYWGGGTTIDTAFRNAVTASGKTARMLRRQGGLRIKVFTSDLPFAPCERDATEDEADAWMGQDGSLSWVRCDRHDLEKATP